MHILFFVDNFPPEVNAPATRTFAHTRQWVKSGHQVTVITCAPNFPKGKVFPGYRNRLWQSEWIDGIRVIRVWTYIAANEGFYRRVLDYISYMISSTLASPFVRNVDVVVGTSPQFFTVCAAFMASRLKKVPFVFEVRDLWPESIIAVGAMQNSRVIRLLERIEVFLYHKAEAIVTVTESIKRKIIEKGVPSTKISVVTNGVDTSSCFALPRDEKLSLELGLEGCFVGGYIGTHGLAHGLETLLDAAEIFKNLKQLDFHFLFIGDGANKAKLVERARSRNLNNVTFVSTVPKNEVSRYWSLLDVSIIHLRNIELFAGALPSKMFESMGMGIPLVHGVAGESADLVRRYQLGVVFRSEDAEALCKAMMLMKNNQILLDGFRKNCLETSYGYDRKNLAADFLKVLASCA
ncbi:MAG: glycosyltransferase family 4 protein [Desulfuromonas sp.]|nr:glycosyltransferase family 4 protein [Desulfuromonas sp.]